MEHSVHLCKGAVSKLHSRTICTVTLPPKRETVLGCRCRGTEQQICTVRLHSRQKGRPHWAVQVPGHRAADLHCTVVLPPKRETVLGCTGAGAPSSRSELYGYTPAKKGDRTGLHRCRGTERRSALCGYTPAKRESVLGCKCRGTCQQICNCTVTLP